MSHKPRLRGIFQRWMAGWLSRINWLSAFFFPFITAYLYRNIAAKSGADFNPCHSSLNLRETPLSVVFHSCTRLFYIKYKQVNLPAHYVKFVIWFQHISVLLNAVQRSEHENVAKKSKQTTEGKRGEKVGEREGRGGEGVAMEEGEGRGRQGGGDVEEGEEGETIEARFNLGIKMRRSNEMSVP